ncbi:MAG: hypothetical protein ACLSGS_04700 [Adlercreutzia sp.]
MFVTDLGAKMGAEGRGADAVLDGIVTAASWAWVWTISSAMSRKIKRLKYDRPAARRGVCPRHRLTARARAEKGA